ncbi:hypothetical protein [Halomonas sp. TD01]|uniref:hypothetical protein n=1 Tax=Halomonas sp. TD01 TaxID=999141 RepID=UPI000214F305|nr:hypothetical protein [Halomonas sp. TD01]EGP17933.1 hypothetical protein GME_19177 [Halomonas sp. TD01]CAH1043268.1 hypothetical protein HPTD01_1746 [Halomonas sp. TD01]
MKRLLKALIVFATLIAITIFIVAFLVFQHVYNFRTRIVENICIDQIFMKDEYNLIDCTNNKVLVQDVSEWIVADDTLYGIALDDGDRYFLIKIKDNSAILLESGLDFSDYLNTLGLPPYSISDSENMAHLFYGAGRDRIFPTEEGCCVPWRRR